MLKTHKETKSHPKNDEHYATKGDLKETGAALHLGMLATKHEIKETELRLKAEIQEVKNELKLELVKVEGSLKSDIKALQIHNKWNMAIQIVIFTGVFAPLLTPLSKLFL
ncbi:hypothetical protein UFOVP51_42 [uncultured Caudovirales phage]|uniref:Uncharacterized protein n=1 Tax=uncultured Caudovirales phage TaxID=2100421 RepID=A0A6J5KTE0_9CAUD|nr:hypothetical protein UFOVP51_42 [uncultured Caudovirales phage]CAB4241037.1 hypothetical protein UFOVP34_64 [uncultured Caudovirales phage]